MNEIPTSLPGHELVAEGLADLAAGRETVAGLLVAMASPRLRELGIEVPACEAAEPSHRLYELLERDGPGAHSRYNALVRRIVSFARAAEHGSRRRLPPPVDERRIRELAHRLGQVARLRVRIYLTGGATAVLEGWKVATTEVELGFEPESDELLRAIPALKESLGVNIELAAPPDFIPELPGWRERSPMLFRDGNVDVHHFDPYSQALSKIQRAFTHDREDVLELIKRRLAEPARLRELFNAIEPELFRPRDRPAQLSSQAGGDANHLMAHVRIAQRRTG